MSHRTIWDGCEIVNLTTTEVHEALCELARRKVGRPDLKSYEVFCPQGPEPSVGPYPYRVMLIEEGAQDFRHERQIREMISEGIINKKNYTPGVIDPDLLARALAESLESAA